MLEPISSNRRVIKTRPSTAGSSRRRYHNIRGTCRSGPSIFVDHTIERKHDDDDEPYPIRKKDRPLHPVLVYAITNRIDPDDRQLHHVQEERKRNVRKNENHHLQLHLNVHRLDQYLVWFI